MEVDVPWDPWVCKPRVYKIQSSPAQWVAAFECYRTLSWHASWREALDMALRHRLTHIRCGRGPCWLMADHEGDCDPGVRKRA